MNFYLYIKQSKLVLILGGKKSLQSEFGPSLYSRRPKSERTDFGAFHFRSVAKHVRFSKTECFRSDFERSVG